MPRYKDITGETYHKLTVLERAGNDKYGKSLWLCKCECGNTSTVLGTNLRRPNGTTSCGCATGGKTHGLSNLPEYHVYRGMIARCQDPKRESYKHYGARGIKVCKRWLEGPQNFLDDMGRRPSDIYSLDRIDPNGDYEPSNCRWATTAQQTANKRPTLTKYQLVKQLIKELTPKQLKLLKKFVDKL